MLRCFLLLLHLSFLYFFFLFLGLLSIYTIADALQWSPPPLLRPRLPTRSCRTHTAPLWSIYHTRTNPISQNHLSMHHNEVLFPDSHSFIPDRWLNSPRAPRSNTLGSLTTSPSTNRDEENTKRGTESDKRWKWWRQITFPLHGKLHAKLSDVPRRAFSACAAVYRVGKCVSEMQVGIIWDGVQRRGICEGFLCTDGGSWWQGLRVLVKDIVCRDGTPVIYGKVCNENGRKFTVKNDVPDEVFYKLNFMWYTYTYFVLFRPKLSLKLLSSKGYQQTQSWIALLGPTLTEGHRLRGGLADLPRQRWLSLRRVPSRDLVNLR
jgi:hypothetical protein